MLQDGALVQERYRIIRHVGRGGMGSVYLADDLRLHTSVALKQMLVTGDALTSAFTREARLLASLRHATIPRVIDYFADQDGHFLVMEYIPGDDTGSLLASRSQPFGMPDVIRWANQLLDALEYLHTQNPPIIHRDIKPQNLKLTAANDVVLLDFGLAKTSLIGASGPQAQSIFGYTPHYAPIEQIQGQGTDARSDLYSLGATLYHMLTGRMPVDAVTRAAATVNEQPDPLVPASEINPQVSPAVAAALMESMAQKANDRPASAAEMRELLALAVSDSPLLDRPRLRTPPRAVSEEALPTAARSTIPLARPGDARPAARPRWRAAIAAAAVFAAVAIGGAGWALSRGVSAPATQTPEGGASTAAPLAEPMSGSLNIAVAAFEPGGGAQCAVKPDEAYGLAMVAYDALAKELRTARGSSSGASVGASDIELRSPEQTGALDASGSRASAAAAKARELNADVLIYGDVTCSETPRQTTLRPQIYLSDRKLLSFDQLLFIGEHEFGSPISGAGLPTSGPTRQALAQGLAPRIAMITQFLIGLDYFYAGSYEPAATAFKTASSVAGVDDAFLTSLALQWSGTTASRRQQYAEARESYQQVLELVPGDPTALYSLANATYLTSNGSCSEGAAADREQDAAGLNEALRLVDQVSAPGDTLVDKTIRGMAAFTRGQIYSCMTRAQIADSSGATDHRVAAEEALKQAVDLLDREGSFTRDYLAESHFELGQLYVTGILQADPATAAAQWRRAGAEYCEASAYSGYANRQAVFHHVLAAIHGYLGEYDQARLERERALALDPSTTGYDATMHAQWLEESQTRPSKTPIWTCTQDAAR